MATYTLYLYPTDFRLEENCIYDDLESYLNTLTAFQINNFQYFKQDDEFDRTIKINYNQSATAIGLNFTYNYMKTVNSETGNIQYWYITGTN